MWFLLPLLVRYISGQITPIVTPQTGFPTVLPTTTPTTFTSPGTGTGIRRTVRILNLSIQFSKNVVFLDKSRRSGGRGHSAAEHWFFRLRWRHPSGY